MELHRMSFHLINELNLIVINDNILKHCRQYTYTLNTKQSVINVMQSTLCIHELILLIGELHTLRLI